MSVNPLCKCKNISLETLDGKPGICYIIKDIYISASNAAANAGTEVTVLARPHGGTDTFVSKLCMIPSVAYASSCAYYELGILCAVNTGIQVGAANIGVHHVFVTYYEVTVSDN